MYAAPERDRERIDGLASFAAVAFLTAIGLVAALARVGAPDRLVEILGPLVALIGLLVIGAVNRTARLADFLAARRAVPPIYGGLAFAATAAGLALTLGPESSAALAPWPAAALGLAGAALVIGPLLRRADASAAADIVATRFPFAAVRILFGLASAAVGALTAAAGFAAATAALIAATGGSPRLAEAVAALALAIGVVPGGLKGLLWSDAASAAGALAIAAIGAALAWSGGGESAAMLVHWLSIAPRPADSNALLRAVAGVFALVGFLPLAAPALGAQEGYAQRTGVYGLAFGVVALALGATAWAAFAPDVAADRAPTAAALIGAAAWLPALALARAGVYTAARGLGVDLSAAYARFALLASRRIALTRLTMALVIVAVGVSADRGLIDSPRALAWALALNLAFASPLLALGLAERGGVYAACALIATAAAVLATRLGPVWQTVGPADILVGGLIAGASGLLAGAFAALFERRPPPPNIKPYDPFADLPFAAPE
jgi:cation/acetate symporter